MPTLVDRRPDGAGARLTVSAPAALRAQHRAIGQYCVVTVGGARGYFALASRPGAAQFEFYVAPGGDAAEVLATCPLGTALEIEPPAGDGFGVEAALAQDADGPWLVAATGSALGAVLGALEALSEAGRSAVLYYGTRTAAAAPYQAELAALTGLDVKMVCSRPTPEWAGPTGRVQALLSADAPDLSAAWLVACGQSAMQADVQALAARLGLAESRFLTNY